MKPELTPQTLQLEATKFAAIESSYPEPSLFGVTDGKAIGTYIEQKFKAYLAKTYDFTPGNSASGIDLPSLNVDIKVTSVVQPQSSCPFKSARQKIFGLQYGLLVFVYAKTDNSSTRTATLSFAHTLFVEAARTADFQTTTGLNEILRNKGNEEDLIAFMRDRFLPVDDIEAMAIARQLVAAGSVETGYLTISNALQWRLQYGRAIREAGTVTGILRLT